MGIFNRKSKAQEKKPGLVTLVTDYPDISIEIEKNMLDAPIYLFMATFTALFKAELEKKGKEIQQILLKRLTKDGILEVPIAVSEEDGDSYIYPLPNIEQSTVDYYHSIKKHIENELKATCYYFAPQELPTQIREISTCRPLVPSDFEKFEESLKDKTFAMWWADSKGEKFGGSETQKLLLETYETMDGIETVINAMIAKQLGLCEKEVGRVHLPEEMAVLPTTGPEGKVILIGISQEKGIQFKFNVKDTSKEYRLNFLKALNRMIRDVKDLLKQRPDFQKDEYDRSPLKWLKYSIAAITETEKEEDLDMFGVTML